MRFLGHPLPVLAVLLCACGSETGEPQNSHEPAAVPPSYYCRDWPDAREYCDGPRLTAEEAATQIADSHDVKSNERLFKIESSNGGAFAPDGRQLLTGDGWGFLYDLGDGFVEWRYVRTVPISPFLAQSNCPPPDRIDANGITRQVQDASELLRSKYMTTLEPGTFSTFYVVRQAACNSLTGLARTLVEVQFTTPPRLVNVEFDGAGALVGACQVEYRGKGCR